MRYVMLVQRPLAFLAVAGAVILAPSAAQAQLAVQTANISVLILPPVPAAAGDSAFAIQVGDAVRKRVESKLRLKLRVISKEKMAEALASSGFPPDAILDENSAQQLARFMNVDAYVSGELTRNTESPTLKLRLVDNRRSGLSGWVSIKGVAGEDVNDFAVHVADSVDVQVKAAEQSRECLDRRDRKDYGSAEERAARAYRISPNHPQASLCLAAILELKKASIDSQIAVHKRAVAGDPMLPRAWDGLARLYQQKGDTAGWADALINNLATNPTDMRMRLAAVELLYRGKQFVRSVEVLDEGLARSPGDNGATQFKARSCFDGQLWACAVETLGERYDADTASQNDSLYILKIILAASAVNDSATVAAAPASIKRYYRLAPDNVAIEKWTGVAVQKFPNSVAFWRRRAAALSATGKRDEALVAWRTVARMDPSDFTSRIQAGQILSEQAGAVFDSLGKITDDLTAKKDTIGLKRIRPTFEPVVAAAWAPADSMLSDAARLSTPETRVNVGALIFQPATKLVQKQNGPVVAISMLQKALPLVAANKQLTDQANFFLGLAYFYKLQTIDMGTLNKTKDCAVVAEILSIGTNGNTAILAGASIQPGTAQQISTMFTSLARQLGPAKTAWKCK